jgi:formylglycine-generating enzyme required for sulfatase activity
LTRRIIVVDEHGERPFAAEQLPLEIGSRATADIRVPGLPTPGPASGAQADGPRALIDLLDERAFLQTTGSAEVVVNGEVVRANRWLENGDVITIAGVRIACGLDPDAVRLQVDVARLEYPTLPPELVEAPAAQPEPIAPVRPRARVSTSTADGDAGHRARLIGFSALGILVLIAGFLFTSHAVLFEVEPAAARVRVTGGLIAPRIGGRYVLREGDYRVLLSADGYHPLRAEIEVIDAPSQTFEFAMQKLPGRVAITTEPSIAATLFVDEQEFSSLPADAVLVEPGERELRIVADRYLEFVTTLEIEGRDVLQALAVELQPGWGDITATSQPAGAEVFIDDEEVGATPATLAVMAGARQIVLRKDGYKPWKRELRVEAGVPIELPPVELVEADGLLTVISLPPGASVSVDGRYRGTTPVEVELAPGRDYEVITAKAGYSTETRKLRMASRSGRTLRVELQARIGILRIKADPPDAEVLIDGQPRGAANQEFSLPARTHRIEIRKDGLAPFITEISPQPGLPENLNVQLMTPEEAVLAAIQSTVATGDGTTMILVRPGDEFEMGAARREQGRRPNEARHRVRMSRPFYLAATEITNSQFQGFQPKHTSGSEKYRQLATGNHPAVMLGWEEATGYCNWLSNRDGLPPAYVYENGDIVLAQPVGTGYRLPTEAEWAWAARFTGGGGQLKYPWGERMPPAAGSGNYADKSARSVLPKTLGTYTDRFPITSPVGSFPPSPIGIHDLGGNVAEWVNDRYTVYTQSVGVAVDPVGPDKGQYHVIRGSGWRHSSIGELRYAYRDFGDRGRLDVGFRIARYAEDPPE